MWPEDRTRCVSVVFNVEKRTEALRRPSRSEGSKRRTERAHPCGQDGAALGLVMVISEDMKVVTGVTVDGATVAGADVGEVNQVAQDAGEHLAGAILRSDSPPKDIRMLQEVILLHFLDTTL